MRTTRKARPEKTTSYVASADPSAIQAEIEAFRAACEAPAREGSAYGVFAAGTVAGLGAVGIGVASGRVALALASIGLALVLAVALVLRRRAVAPRRDGKRLEKLGELLRSLDLAPGLPVVAGADFLALHEDARRVVPEVAGIAEVPRSLIVGRPWCAARATLANGLELSVVRSARTRAFVQRGRDAAGHAYALVDAVAVRYDAERFPQLADAAPTVQAGLVVPASWEVLAVAHAPGMLAVAVTTKKEFAQPDYDVRGALEVARQLTALADASRCVVAPQSVRARRGERRSTPVREVAAPVR